jgi:hypothetical protein
LDIRMPAGEFFAIAAANVKHSASSTPSATKPIHQSEPCRLLRVHHPSSERDLGGRPRTAQPGQ